MTVDLTPQIENALKAFEQVKGMVEGFDKKLTEIGPKMDAFDQASFKKMSDDISGAIERSQKEQARAKALEDELSALKTAFNRVPAEGAVEGDEKKLSAKRKELFNKFARTSEDQNKTSFDTFMKRNAKDEIELKALSVNSDVGGGYLTMPEFGGVIKTFAYESSPIRMLAASTTIGTDTLEYILDNDANTSGWVGETAARTDTTTPTLGKLDIYVNEVYSQPKVTQKLLDDGMFDVEAWVAGKVAEEFGRKEATAFVVGTGVTQPKGLMSYASSGASTTTTIAAQQIEQVNTGDAANFTYNGLVNLQNALKEAYQANAAFLFRRASNANIMQIKDGMGRPIFNMVFDKNVGLQPTLMGQPCYYAADIAAIGANALAMAYGDIRKAYQIVDRAGIRILRDPYTSTPYIKFYTTKRVGGAVVNFEAVKIQKMA